MIKRSREKKETAFDRKLKDIEREKRRVQDEIKALSRALEKGEALPVPSYRIPPPPRSSGQPALKPDNTAAPGTELGELFASSKSVEPVQDKRPLVRGDERFTNYFSAGGFKSPMPARQERSVQKNKAIFMVVLVILVAYIIFAVFLR